MAKLGKEVWDVQWLQDRIRALEAKLKAAEEREKWIPVGERLPEYGVVVLVAGGAAYFDGKRWMSVICEVRPISWDVTHWRPLPPSLEPERSVPDYLEQMRLGPCGDECILTSGHSGPCRRRGSSRCDVASVRTYGQSECTRPPGHEGPCAATPTEPERSAEEKKT